MRQCGQCGACCDAIGVQELNKPPNQPCQFLKKSGMHRCKIYDNRPGECKSFRCSWLIGLFSANERPDKTGIVPWGKVKNGSPVFCLSEVYPGAFDTVIGRRIRAQAKAKFGEIELLKYTRPRLDEIP